MANVFLSYDHEDLPVARSIASALEKAGHTVWYDRQIHGGAQYSRKIEQALDAADAVVVLWSERSLDSAWVRDEAAEGRDRAKLVPLSIDGVTPPIGFRQFQTIALGSWAGRGKVPRLPELLEAIRNQGGETHPATAPRAAGSGSSGARRIPHSALIGVAAVLLLLVAGYAAWTWFGSSKLPVVAVVSANPSPRSQAAASDLLVKLGSLAQVGQGKWQLVDGSSDRTEPDLVFRTADTGSVGQPKASLVLLDGKDDSLLWSREFEFPPGGQADLRQQLSLTAGRVLGCALESREAGGLARDLSKLFLNACAMLVEIGNQEPETVARPLRSIVEARPDFKPAWGRLLLADATIADMAAYSDGPAAQANRQLRADMEKARKVVPDLPQLALLDIRVLPATSYEQRLNLLAKAAARAPDEAEIFAIQSQALQGVGRMNESIEAARRAGELDPLSPLATTTVIMTLAYAGQLDEARKELAKAERLWAGTGALRDTLWGFHLRFGDPDLARRLASFRADGLDAYLAARANPSPANVEKFVSLTRGQHDGANQGAFGFVTQALAEFNRTEELLEWLNAPSAERVATSSYLLFRPAFAGFRRDPRFMAVAARIGLVDYWLSTGEWPDFCRQPGLPYDCKAEAMKHAR